MFVMTKASSRNSPLTLAHIGADAVGAALCPASMCQCAVGPGCAASCQQPHCHAHCPLHVPSGGRPPPQHSLPPAVSGTYVAWSTLALLAPQPYLPTHQHRHSPSHSLAGLLCESCTALYAQAAAMCTLGKHSPPVLAHKHLGTSTFAALQLICSQALML